MKIKSNELKPCLLVGKFYSNGWQKLRYVGEHKKKDGSSFFEAKLPSPYGGPRIIGSAKDPFEAFENARQKLIKIENDPGFILGARNSVKPVYTFGEVYKMLSESKKDVVVRETTRNRDLHIKKCSKIYDKDITRITQQMLVDLLNDLKTGKKGKKAYSDSYVKSIMQTIKYVFIYAHKRRIIDFLPFDDDLIKRIHWNEGDSRKREPLTVDETKKYLEFAETRNPYIFHVVSLLLITGMRCGELIGLEWSDVDFAEKTIHIRKTLRNKSLPEAELREPKTESGKRSIPMFKAAETALVYLKDYQEMFNTANTYSILDVRSKGHEIKRIPNLVITTMNCTPDSTDGIRTKIQRVLEAYNRSAQKAGLKEMRWFTTHELRNTCITRIWEQLGLSVALKVYVGHMVKDFSLKTYSAQSVNYLRGVLKDYDYLKATEWTAEMYEKKFELEELLEMDDEM